MLQKKHQWLKRWDLCIIMIMIFTLISTLVLIPDSQVVSVWMYLCHGSPCSSELLDHSPRASEIVVNQWNEQICMNTIQYNTMWICKWNVNFEQSNNLLMALGLFLCLNQVMLTSLRRHQGLVLDHCKNEHRRKNTNTWTIARMSTRRRMLLVFMALLQLFVNNVLCCKWMNFFVKVNQVWQSKIKFNGQWQL